MAEPGQILSEKYRILRLIGEGGMGAVFEGENMAIHRRVAIKVLHPAAAGNADAVMRFEREAQAAGRIGSDHILEVLDLGKMPDGERYMVMEYLDGEPLSNRIRQLGRMTAEQIAPLAQQILIGLGAAHAAGIVHRDLKPDNVFILREKAGRRDFVKLIDFGISKFNSLSGDMSMTRTGAVMGTPYYMSPEQAKGSGVVDHRSDLYAVGVILYEAATGQVPFNASTFNELLFKIVLSTPAPLRDVVPDINPAFAAIVEKAMAREPGERFASSADMFNALSTLVPGGAQIPGSEPPAGTPTTTQISGLPTTTGAVPTHQVTQGGFAASQSHQLAAPAPRKAPLGIIAAAASLLIVGGAFGAYKVVTGGKDSAAAGSSAPSETPKPPVEIAPAPVPAPAPTEIAQPIATDVPSPVTTPSASAAKVPATPGRPPGGAAAVRPPAGPVKPPAGQPPAAPPATTKGRDFGY